MGNNPSHDAEQGTGAIMDSDNPVRYQGLETEALVRPTETIHVETTAADLTAAKELLKYALSDDTDGSSFDMILGYVRSDHVDLLVAVGLTTSFVLGFLGENEVVKTILAAASGNLSDRKIRILEVLVEVARFPQHRGGVAGSGILGVICAMALSNKGGEKCRALALTGLGVLPINPYARETDEKRELEYFRLREQLRQVNLPKVCVDCISTCQGSQDAVFEASITATIALISCDDMVEAFHDVKILPAVLEQLNETLNAFERSPDEDEAEDLESKIQLLLTLFDALLGAAIKYQKKREDIFNEVVVTLEENHSGDVFLKAMTLSKFSSKTLVNFATINRKLLAEFGLKSEQTNWAQESLHGLCSGLCRLITFGKDYKTVEELLLLIQQISTSNPWLLADPRSIERTLLQITDLKMPSSTSSTASLQITASLAIAGLPRYCASCFKTDQLKRCSRCKSVSYCSRQCQVVHYKAHKPNCILVPFQSK